MSMSTSANFGYGCIIDAGSSGSRIYLYRWPKEEGNALTKVEQEALFNDERSVGINDARGIDLLDELLSLTKAALPPDTDPSDVPIYLGATAGMRLLNSEFEAITMSHIRSMLHASGFLFHDEWARIISGDEESIYGWLVANYLKNNGSFPSDSSTYGALDLGGASTQISLLSQSAAAEDRYPLRIGNLNYPLYTHSYLYYGADQARMQYETKFVLPSSNRVNPCYPVGYTDPGTGVSGSSTWDECFDSVATLFDKERSNLRGGEQSSTFDITPPVYDTQQRFVLMSVFVFVWDFVGLKIGTETDDLNTLKARAGDVCSLTHTQQTTQYDLQMKDRPPRRKTNKPFAQCFNAAFSYHLLSKGYGMPVSKTPIEIYYEINGGKVQWALGLMLIEANKLDWINKEGKLDTMYRNMGNRTYFHLFMMLIAFSLILGGLIRSVWMASLLGIKTAKRST